MGQILVRKIDDGALERLRLIAQDRKISVEALARQAIEREAGRATSAEMRDALATIDRLRNLSPPTSEDSVPLIRKLREDGPSDD